jgi:hypothetical protein
MERLQHLAFICLASLPMIVTPGAMAQTGKPKPPETARFGNPGGTVRNLEDLFFGVIKTMDKKEIVLEKTKFGTDQAIVLTEKTKFVRDGAPSKAEDLKVGEQVWVRMKPDKKTGEMRAEVVLSGIISPTIRKD